MMMSGIASRAPDCNHDGNQDSPTIQVLVNVCNMPIINAPAMASGIEDMPPIRAAPSAGTMSAVNLPTVNEPVTVPARTPAAPARREARSQLKRASLSGEYPSKTAPFSLPAAARVARPTRVKRKIAHKTPPMMIAEAARASASTDTGKPSPRKFWKSLSLKRTASGLGMMDPY